MCAAFSRKESLLARRQGQIIPRGNRRWLVRVSMGRQPETGRRRYLNRTVDGSYRAAEHYLSTQIQVGREVAGEQITLNQILDRWLELSAQPKLRPKSY